MKAAERRFNGCRHRRHVAVLVGDSDVAGSVFCAGVGTERDLTEVSGLRLPERRVRFDQCRTLFQVGRIEHRRNTLARQRDEVGVDDVLVAVGVGQALRLVDQMHRFRIRVPTVAVDACRGHRRDVEVGKDAHRRSNRDPARRRPGHRHDAVSVVLRRHRLATHRLVVLEVVGGEETRGHAVRRRAGLGDDRVGDGSGVQGLRAVGCQGAQRLCVGGVGQLGAGGLGRSVGVEEVRAGVVVGLEVFGGFGDCGCEAWRDVEAVVGEADCRVEEILPSGTTMFVMDLFEHPYCARDADGAARGAGARNGCSLVGGADVAQVVLGGGGWRSLSAVVGVDLVGLRVVVQRERSTADARRLRLDEAEDHLRGHECVGRRAAIAQRLAGGLGGERVGGRRGVGVGLHGLHAGAVAGSGLGSGGDVLGRLWRRAGVGLSARRNLTAGDRRLGGVVVC